MPAAKPRPGSLGKTAPVHLGDLLGSTWDGFRLSMEADGQGVFHHDSWRRSFTAGDLRALFWQCQQVYSMELKAKQQQAEIDRLNAALEAMEARAAYYRRLVTLEARAGLMLSSLIE